MVTTHLLAHTCRRRRRVARQVIVELKSYDRRGSVRDSGVCFHGQIWNLVRPELIRR